MIVFDLDFTIWPLYMDSYTVGPPFQRIDNFAIKDPSGEKLKLYPDMHDIIYQIKLQKPNTKIGIASRSHTSEWCKVALNLLPIRKPSNPPLPEDDPDHKPIMSYIDQYEIYPGSKVTHFKRLSKVAGIPFTSMIFFDDEPRNIKEVSNLGVTCILVKNGMRVEDFVKGLSEFQNRKDQTKVIENWLAGGRNSKKSNGKDKRNRVEEETENVCEW